MPTLSPVSVALRGSSSSNWSSHTLQSLTGASQNWNFSFQQKETEADCKSVHARTQTRKGLVDVGGSALAERAC